MELKCIDQHQVSEDAPPSRVVKTCPCGSRKGFKIVKKNKKNHRVRNKEHDWKLVKKKVTLTNKKKQAFIN